MELETVEEKLIFQYLTSEMQQGISSLLFDKKAPVENIFPFGENIFYVKAEV